MKNIIATLAFLLAVTAAFAQTTITTDQGPVQLTQHTVTNGEIVKLPKDSLSFTKNAVIVTQNGTPLQKAGRTVYMQTKDGSNRLFVILQNKNGNWTTSTIKSMLPYFLGIGLPVDTLIMIYNKNDYESELVFCYDPATTYVSARTPLGGQLMNYGKTTVGRFQSSYGPLDITWGYAVDQWDEGIPTMWFLWVENTETGAMSVRMYLPEFDMAWTHGSQGDIYDAYQEAVIVVKFNEKWSTSQQHYHGK